MELVDAIYLASSEVLSFHIHYTSTNKETHR